MAGQIGLALVLLVGSGLLIRSGSSIPSHLCERVNRVIHGNVGDGSGRFITFFYGLLDGNTGRLIYTNAGHNAPVVVRENGTHARLRRGAPLWEFFRNGHMKRTKFSFRRAIVCFFSPTGSQRAGMLRAKNSAKID
ncbi:MAG TPA: SpoIIE family protein phosphatase [Acidobacteriota bacterium]